MAIAGVRSSPLNLLREASRGDTILRKAGPFCYNGW